MLFIVSMILNNQKGYKMFNLYNMSGDLIAYGTYACLTTMIRVEGLTDYILVA